MEKEKVYGFWLHNLPGIGDRTIEKLLRHFGSAREVFCASNKELGQLLKEKTLHQVVNFKKEFDPYKAYGQMEKKKIRFYTTDDEEYPSRLRELIHPPYGIYCLGRLPEESCPAVAVIGARECSEYGKYMAEAFAGGMAAAGISIISGMARGIDGIGQEAAIKGEGRTYAVLGCGVDICYPASNKALYRKIVECGGGILSVFPPGREPVKQQFPERNRIVAGLCDLLLVVEARQKSGTWITVDMALEQGKHVYAVPGRLTDRLSDGCNLLLRQGAGIALSPEDLVAEIMLLDNRKEIGNTHKKDKKEEEGLECFLDYNPRSIEEIIRSMSQKGIEMKAEEVMDGLMTLCMEGRAKQFFGNYFAKTQNGF